MAEGLLQRLHQTAYLCGEGITHVFHGTNISGSDYPATHRQVTVVYRPMLIRKAVVNLRARIQAFRNRPRMIRVRVQGALPAA